MIKRVFPREGTIELAEFDRLLERPRVLTMAAEIKCSLCRRETAITCRDSVGYPRSREEVHHSRRIRQCYPGDQCTSERQKAHPGSSRGPHLPRGHNAVPQWERLHLFRRGVSYHYTAVHCSVRSFNGNCKPREPSLKSPRRECELSACLKRRRLVCDKIVTDNAL